MTNENNLKELIEEFKWVNPKATKSLHLMLFGYLHYCEQGNIDLSADVLHFAEYLEQFFEQIGV